MRKIRALYRVGRVCKHQWATLLTLSDILQLNKISQKEIARLTKNAADACGESYAMLYPEELNQLANSRIIWRVEARGRTIICAFFGGKKSYKYRHILVLSPTGELDYYTIYDPLRSVQWKMWHDKSLGWLMRSLASENADQVPPSTNNRWWDSTHSEELFRFAAALGVARPPYGEGD